MPSNFRKPNELAYWNWDDAYEKGKEKGKKIGLHTHTHTLSPPPKMKKVNHKWILASRPPKTFKCWNRKNTLENATTWHHFSEPLQTRALYYTTTATLFLGVVHSYMAPLEFRLKCIFFQQNIQHLLGWRRRRKIGFMEALKK